MSFNWLGALTLVGLLAYCGVYGLILNNTDADFRVDPITDDHGNITGEDHWHRTRFVRGLTVLLILMIFFFTVSSPGIWWWTLIVTLVDLLVIAVTIGLILPWTEVANPNKTVQVASLLVNGPLTDPDDPYSDPKMKVSPGRRIRLWGTVAITAGTLFLWLVIGAVSWFNGFGFFGNEGAAPEAKPAVTTQVPNPEKTAEPKQEKTTTPTPTASKPTTSNVACAGVPADMPEYDSGHADVVKQGGVKVCTDGSWVEWTNGTVTGQVTNKAVAGQYAYLRFVSTAGKEYILRTKTADYQTGAASVPANA